MSNAILPNKGTDKEMLYLFISDCFLSPSLIFKLTISRIFGNIHQKIIAFSGIFSVSQIKLKIRLVKNSWLKQDVFRKYKSKNWFTTKVTTLEVLLNGKRQADKKIKV